MLCVSLPYKSTSSVDIILNTVITIIATWMVGKCAWVLQNERGEQREGEEAVLTSDLTFPKWCGRGSMDSRM